MYVCASGEIVVAAATRAQLAAKLVTPTVDEIRDIGRTRQSGSPDHIGQARLLFSFGLADTTSDTRSHVPFVVPDARAISRDLLHTLAYKVLQMPMFSSVEMLAPGFVPAEVFHLAGEMLDGKWTMRSLEVA